MICIKCSADIPENSNFCNLCGAKQAKAPHGTKKRGNGQGTVYRRESGKWQAEITLGYYVKNGRKYRKKATKGGFEKKKDALAYIAAMQAGMTPKPNITICELWEMFQREKMEKLGNSKRKAYRTAYKKIGDEIGFRNIADLTVPDLQAVVDKFGTSYYTKLDIKNLLSHLYKIAMRDDHVEKNKASYIQLPEYIRNEREVLTEEEIERIWEDYRTSPTPITAHILVMLYTGMRPGELLTIEQRNIHLDEQYLTGGIKTEKGRKRRIILPDKIMPVIRYMMEIGVDGKLTSFRTAYFFRTAWAKKREELGLREELQPYCCRHTYVTRLTALKLSPAMLQELAGHEDYETTLSYTHLSVDDRLAEVNRLD